MEGQYHEREEKGGSRVRKKRDMLVLPGDEIRTTTEPSFMLHCSLSFPLFHASLYDRKTRDEAQKTGEQDRKIKEGKV